MRLNLQQLLDEHEITKYRFAKELDMSYAFVHRMCKGDTTGIQFDTLEKICNYFNCTPNDVLIPDITESTE